MIGMSHLGVCVSDPDRATGFYARALGAEEHRTVVWARALPANHRDLPMGGTRYTPRTIERFGS